MNGNALSLCKSLNCKSCNATFFYKIKGWESFCCLICKLKFQRDKFELSGEYSAKYVSRRVKIWCHGAVHKALKQGLLNKPETCEVCKINKTNYAHHYSYYEPIKVIWVCSNCHQKLHKKPREIGITYHQRKMTIKEIKLGNNIGHKWYQM